MSAVVNDNSLKTYKITSSIVDVRFGVARMGDFVEMSADEAARYGSMLQLVDVVPETYKGRPIRVVKFHTSNAVNKSAVKSTESENKPVNTEKVVSGKIKPPTFSL